MNSWKYILILNDIKILFCLKKLYIIIIYFDLLLLYIFNILF